MKGLCQNCLKVFTFNDATTMLMYHQEDKLCECGGAVCACEDCEAEANSIEAIGIAATKAKHPEKYRQ